MSTAIRDLPAKGEHDEQGKYVLQLFISGNTAQSGRAIVNIRRVCEEHLKGRYSLEVVDLLQSPERASTAEIIALPTLVKSKPGPLRRFIGDLSNTMRLLHGLDIELPADIA